MIEIELRVMGWLHDQWQYVCRTMTPKEIIVSIGLLMACVTFIGLLTYLEPTLMGLTIAITLLIVAVSGVVWLGYLHLKDWVTGQCDAANHAWRVEQMEKSRGWNDQAAIVSQSIPNGDLTPNSDFSMKKRGIHKQHAS